MKNLLSVLLSKTIIEVYKIVIIEDNNELELSDSLVFKTLTGELWQLVVDGSIGLYLLPTASDITIFGEYDKSKLIHKSLLVKKIYSAMITSICNYKKSSYHFGSKFSNASGQFIFGLCFGFDEVILLNEIEFIEMLNTYKDYTLAKISMTDNYS